MKYPLQGNNLFAKLISGHTRAGQQAALAALHEYGLNICQFHSCLPLTSTLDVYSDYES